MADYFTYFSFIVPLPDEAAQTCALNLAGRAAAACRSGEPAGDLPPPLADALEDWRFETEPEASPGKWGLWVHSESGGIDAVCAFVQHLLRRFDPAGRVCFEWTCDCTKPRLDAYGGGAAVITARKIKTFNTADWLQKQMAARGKHQHQPKEVP